MKSIQCSDTYQCTKKVKACQIEEVTRSESGSIHLKLRNGATLEFTGSWPHFSTAEAGGYMVEYEDGYISYSPKEAFEKGYYRTFEEIPVAKVYTDSRKV